MSKVLNADITEKFLSFNNVKSLLGYWIDNRSQHRTCCVGYKNHPFNLTRLKKYWLAF